MSEMDVRYRTDRVLENKGWVLSSEDPERNVFFESTIPVRFRKKLKGKRPDYTLFHDGSPIGIIETKKPKTNLDGALEQGLEYADKLNAPLVFATNGTFCKTSYLYNGKELFLNGNEVREILSFAEALVFFQEKTNAVYTIPQKVIKSRDELLKLFADANDLLRGEGLRAGIERFSEFANILFLKLLSENNNPEYWRALKKTDSLHRRAILNDSILPELKRKYGGDVIAPVKIEKASVLEKIIEALDPLVLTVVDEDIKGTAFEYFLQKTTNTHNDLGEYFTPRHIVRAMVALVDPKYGEKVYDPFCGTGGFLTETYRYIKQSGRLDSRETDMLKREMLFGRELTTTATVAKMNMILYGDGHNGVSQTDSLENPVNGKYDVVLTNIPFSQDFSEESIDCYYNGLANNDGDAACVLHCFKSLRSGGRMAVIVPVGFLNNRSVKNTRKFLAENGELEVVAVLPRGCFLPYTAASTAIIFLKNKEVSHTGKFHFLNIRNDGFTLDAKRDFVPGKNDLDGLAFSDLTRPERLSKSYDFLINDRWEPSNKNILSTALHKIACLKKGDSITKKTANPAGGGGTSDSSRQKQSIFS